MLVQMIRVGTCGFQYRDWARVFYPVSLAPGNRLEYYSRRFRCCELGFASHRIPEPASMQQLADGSDGRLTFVLRAPEPLTETGPDPELAGRFMSAVWPLASAGQLAGILAAFGPRFGFNRENFARLCAVRDSLAGAALIAEFESADWRSAKAARHLAARGVALACVTSPQMREGTLAAAPPGYVRLEGAHDYGAAELEAVAVGLRGLEDECGEVLVLLNNVRQGRAAVNALALQELLEGSR